ncbi:MAG TPA: ATP-dependent sacrificial sulfur transferase LarE [Thermodesulfovibrionales bacterium]|nr:ATP-dependent sacrificial sulfur transferase LarE [Thermodesulfovibrionales bacterium]
MDKFTLLVNILRDMKSAVIAYSGGVDSTLLLKALQLSGIPAVAVTMASEIMPRNELLSAKRAARDTGIEHRIVETDELSNEKFLNNTPERCYICKDNKFKVLGNIANSERLGFVIDGSNVDDTRDIRPGMKAAAEHGVRSPLVEAGFSKRDIRRHAKKLGLDVWDKPSSPCLATRIPFGTRITREALERIERSEDFLKELGFTEVRVRDHGALARIETAKGELDALLDVRKREMIVKKLKRLGYAFVSIDLEGYKTGKLSRLVKR